MKGGAERVLRILAGLFPEAPIFTLLYDEDKIGDWFPHDRIRTSALQNRYRFLPSSVRFNHHLHLNAFPAAIEAWDFSKFDLVLSSSSAFAHGIITNGSPRHLCYVHSPARYLWDRTADILEQSRRGILGPLRHAYLSRTFHKLRTWDAESADRADVLIAASQTVQRRIELYWRRKSTVIHPPIDDVWFQGAMNEGNPHSYFLVASTLAPYKRIDLAIAACNRLRVPLKIAGEGRDAARLKAMAGPTVEFLGFQSELALRDLYKNARATIFPGDEDFGLVPLESLACGTPVVACKSGGVLETLRDGETALFFSDPTVDSLTHILKEFHHHSFDATTLRQSALPYTRDIFERLIKEQVASLMEKK